MNSHWTTQQERPRGLPIAMYNSTTERTGGISAGSCMKERNKDIYNQLELGNLANVSTRCSNCPQGESEADMTNHH